MTQDSIGYSSPMNRAFQGVNRILFKPFDLGKWFALGFTAWLANMLGNGLQGGGGGGGGGDFPGAEEGSPEFDEFIEQARAWVRENLELVIGIGLAVVVVGLVIGLLLLWVSSRGKFMFLDNAIHNRALVKTPWSEFRRAGNSLFLWRLGFGIVMMFLFLAIGGGIAFFVFRSVQSGIWDSGAILTIVALALLFLLTLLVYGYIWTMLEDFVIPLMYRHSESAVMSWSRFLSLHGRFPGRFLLYFLFRMALAIAASMGAFLIGLATCCIGLIIMAIPYLGAVLLLPVSVFFRLLGPEFLRQFGEDYELPVPPTPPPSV